MAKFDKSYWAEFAINHNTVLDLNERLCSTSSEREKNEIKPLLQKTLNQVWKCIKEIISVNTGEQHRRIPQEQYLNLLKVLADYSKKYVSIEKRHSEFDSNEYQSRVALSGCAELAFATYSESLRKMSKEIEKEDNFLDR